METSNTQSFRPSPELLLERRGPINGPQFFSKSPFRSGHFIAATGTCVIGAVLGLFLLNRSWHSFAGPVIFGFVELGILNIWWRAYRYLGKLRDLHLEGAIREVEPGSPLDLALGVAADATNDLLFFGSTTIASLTFMLIRGVPAH